MSLLFTYQLPHSLLKFSISTKTSTRNKKKQKRIMATIVPNQEQREEKRLDYVKKFDETKTGVKGLVDSGIESIPSIFIHPQDILSDLKTTTTIADAASIIPTIDFAEFRGNKRGEVVDQVSRACRELGFFQVVNHGVPVEELDRTVEAIRGFHELPMEDKAQFYGREAGKAVSFFSNVDLYQSKAASWRDTLQVRLGPKLPEVEEIPGVCRTELVRWSQHSKDVAEIVMEAMCEGLGLKTSKLKDMTFLEARTMAAHYYPPCPQPDLTIGITPHTDPGVLTLVLQDHVVGGLQIRYNDDWVPVKPHRGAIVVNVGDILQILSNDEYRSVKHMVLANPLDVARISIAVFFNPLNRENLYGPLPELISEEKPARYRHFMYGDYITRYFTKELGGKTLTDYYRV